RLAPLRSCARSLCRQRHNNYCCRKNWSRGLCAGDRPNLCGRDCSALAILHRQTCASCCHRNYVRRAHRTKNAQNRFARTGRQWSSMMSESDQSDDKQNSAVGYRRPPVNRQFKPGQSGNPRGRPKGSKNLLTTFAEALSRPVTWRDKSGKIRTLSKMELSVEFMVNKAAAGDPKAFAMVVQMADKYEVYKRQTQSHTEIVNSALLKLSRGIERM